MTPTERLEQIRKRVEAATIGPWESATSDTHYGTYLYLGVVPPESVNGVPPFPKTVQFRGDGDNDFRGDVDFIAHAREDVPWLLEQLSAQTRALEEARRERDEAAQALMGAFGRWDKEMMAQRDTAWRERDAARERIRVLEEALHGLDARTRPALDALETYSINDACVGLPSSGGEPDLCRNGSCLNCRARDAVIEGFEWLARTASALTPTAPEALAAPHHVEGETKP